MINRDNQIETLEKELDTLRQQSENREVKIFFFSFAKKPFLERINCITMKRKSMHVRQQSMNLKIKSENINFKSKI